jgi:hypothetical protein
MHKLMCAYMHACVYVMCLVLVECDWFCESKLLLVTWCVLSYVSDIILLLVCVCGGVESNDIIQLECALLY